jgi:hypothetical protein
LVLQVEDDLGVEDDVGRALNRVRGGRDHAPPTGFATGPEESGSMDTSQESVPPPDPSQVETSGQQPSVPAPAAGRRGRPGARTWPRNND